MVHFKKNSIFAAFNARNNFMVFVCVAFLFATNTALYAAEYRLPISNGCCATKPVIVPCRTERGSLLLFNNFNFSFMQGTMKNASKVNNSSLANTSAHETGKSFSFDGTHNVQVIIINGEPWFIAKGVCMILEIGNTSCAVHDLDDDEKGIVLNDTLGGNQKMLVVNESGLYALILQSRKPVAKKFRKWVTSEVIPAIRKTGMYVTEKKAEELTGRSYYVKVDSKYDNLYIGYVMEAFREFFEEELNGCGFTERRLNEKIKAAQVLFPEYRQVLRNQNVKNRMK